jgi:hypothetical protein
MYIHSMLLSNTLRTLKDKGYLHLVPRFAAASGESFAVEMIGNRLKGFALAAKRGQQRVEVGIRFVCLLRPGNRRETLPFSACRVVQVRLTFGASAAENPAASFVGVQSGLCAGGDSFSFSFRNRRENVNRQLVRGRIA